METTSFDEVFNAVRKATTRHQINATNWVGVVVTTMEYADTLKDVSGHQKRDIVCDVVRKLVETLPMRESDRAFISLVTDRALPFIIDVIVDGTLGKLAINVVEASQRCIAKCKSNKKRKKL